MAGFGRLKTECVSEVIRLFEPMTNEDAYEVMRFAQAVVAKRNQLTAVLETAAHVAAPIDSATGGLLLDFSKARRGHG